MKKKVYLLGLQYVCRLFFCTLMFYGTASFATISSTSGSKTKSLSDGIFEALVQEVKKSQERQEAVSSILNEKKS